MTEIPNDVMKAAETIAKEATRASMIDPLMPYYIVVTPFIARAILAERERCAKIAYAYADAHTSDHKIIGHIIGRKILFDTVDDGS